MKLIPGILGRARRLIRGTERPIGELEFRSLADDWKAKFVFDLDRGVGEATSLMRRKAQTQPTIYRADEGLFQDRASVTSTFGDIYRTNMWGDGSGGGSVLHRSVAMYLGFLEAIIEHHRIASIVDVGCGDWQFTRFMRLGDISYVGVDAAQSVIETNNRSFGSPTVRFIHSDAAAKDWPTADLAITKDVLQHLPNALVAGILKQCSASRVVLVTNDYHPSNLECRIGDTRPLDPTAPPFYWGGAPVLAFDDKVTFLKAHS